MTSFVDQLAARMVNLVCNSFAQVQRLIYVYKLLLTCTHVFVQDLAESRTINTEEALKLYTYCDVSLHAYGFAVYAMQNENSHILFARKSVSIKNKILPWNYW